MKKKAQASTEYIVILAVVIIIALVVVAVLGGFIDIGAGATEQAAKAYWRTAEIGLVDWAVAGNTFTYVARNNQDYRITLTGVTMGGVADAALTGVTLTPGETHLGTVAYTCAAGESYAEDVSIEYDNIELGVTKQFTGAQGVVGKCST